MNSEDGQVYSVCILQSKHKQTNVNIQTKFLQITAFSVVITILNQRTNCKDYIEFVTVFPCLLEHPVPALSHDSANPNNSRETQIPRLQKRILIKQYLGVKQALTGLLATMERGVRKLFN